MDRATLYVDVENLQDIAKQAVVCAIEQWPSEFPKPDVLQLYVKASQTELWRIWTGHIFHSIDVKVRGTQYYTLTGSKNSADICLALDALADLLKGRTTHVAIMSDDSDYASLFATLKQELRLTDNRKIPFKWFLTDRPDTRSPMLMEFFPSEYLHTVTCSRAPSPAPVIGTQLTPEGQITEAERLAQAIIRDIPLGPFKSSDCKKIIARNFPKNQLGKANSATLGTQFSKIIWPILQQYGVRLPNPKKKPRRYEMTAEAKKSAGGI